MLSNFKLHLRRKLHGDDDSEAEALSHKILWDKCIKEATLPLTNSAFLPAHWQANLLDNNKRIRKTLADSEHIIPRHDVTKLVDYVHTKARTVFLLLVFIDKVNHIRNFEKQDFKDDDLPISFTPDWNGVFLNNQDCRDAQQYFPKWTSVEKDAFASKQWVFLAPLFSGEPFSHKLAPKQPLPFKPLDESSLGNGFFGAVCRIEIPSSHLNKPKTHEYHEVALKCLIMAPGPQKNEYFLREKEILEEMSKLRHPHLIQAYSAYQRGTDMGFVFPYAKDGNLAEFWKQNNTILSPSVVSWALIQMKGLADGLRKLHNAKMRHGDIKPQNILIFENHESKRKDLVIADVGLAKYCALYTHERIDPANTRFGSRRYEPPEVDGQTLPEGEARQLPRSHKYDLWSLGCVFLEFLIWLDSGAQGLTSFLSISSVRQREARFWEGDLVRPEIVKYMDDLEQRLGQRDQQYTSLSDVLSLIRKRLLIRVDERTDSSSLFNELEIIESRFSLNSHGLSDPPQTLPGDEDRADDTAPDAAALSRNLSDTHG